MEREWTIKVFISLRNVDVFDEWLITLPKKAKAKIKKMINHLAITKKWKRPLTGKLKGYNNLVEIIVLSNNVQYRPIGCYGPNTGEFTILIGAIERGSKFEPVNAPDTAYARSKLIHKEKHTNDFV